MFPPALIVLKGELEWIGKIFHFRRFERITGGNESGPTGRQKRIRRDGLYRPFRAVTVASTIQGRRAALRSALAPGYLPARLRRWIAGLRSRAFGAACGGPMRN
jgi:hypothetical protein